MQFNPIMRSITRSRTILGLAGIVLAPILAASPAATQSTQGIQVQVDKGLNLVTVDCDNVDFKLVIRAVFVRVGNIHIDLSRTAANGIAGKVTVHLRNASVDTFLRTVLDQVGGEHTSSHNTYDVRRRSSGGPAPASGRPATNPTAPGKPVTAPDPAPGGAAIPPGAIPAAFKKRVALVTRDIPFETVLSQLGARADVALILSPEAPKNLHVTVRAADEPLIDVIDKICRAAKLKRDITGERSATISPATSVTIIVGGRDASGRCTNCRYDLKSDWQFCPACGQQFSGK